MRLVAAAEAEVTTLTVEEVIEAMESGALLVDVRDVREVKREGRIPDSYHAPRGMLEFWVDPESQYHHEALSSADRLVLYCNLGTATWGGVRRSRPRPFRTWVS